MHPLLELLLARPQLLADHALAYGELVGQEFGQARRAWQQRWLLQIAALTGVVTAVILAGVALMLWAVVPAPQIHAPWALVLAPLLPLVAALACLMAIRQRGPLTSFAITRQQFNDDLAMLRAATSA